MERFGYIAMQTVSALPTVIVLLTGLVLAGARRRRLARRPRVLLYFGVGALLVDAGLGIGYSLLLPHLVAEGWAGQSRVSVMQLAMAVGLLRVLLAPIGLGLLIAAALADRRTPGPASPAAWGDWTPLPADPEAGAAAGVAGATSEEAGGAGESRSGGSGGADFPPLPRPAGQDGTT